MTIFNVFKEKGENMSTFTYKQKRLKHVLCKIYLLKTPQASNFKWTGPKIAVAEAITASWENIFEESVFSELCNANFQVKVIQARAMLRLAFKN